MSPTCRRAAALTSGDHPEPDPDLSSPAGPDLRERGRRTSAHASRTDHAPTAGNSAPPRALRPVWRGDEEPPASLRAATADDGTADLLPVPPSCPLALWRRGRHRPGRMASGHASSPALSGSHFGWRAAPGPLAWLGAGCPATAARVAACPAFQLRGGGLGREALGGRAWPGAGLCAGQRTRSVLSPSTSSIRPNSPAAWPAWGTVCAMSQARTTREGAGPPMAAW
jgi:hypothetical protein